MHLFLTLFAKRMDGSCHPDFVEGYCIRVTANDGDEGERLLHKFQEYLYKQKVA